MGICECGEGRLGLLTSELTHIYHLELCVYGAYKINLLWKSQSCSRTLSMVTSVGVQGISDLKLETTTKQ